MVLSLQPFKARTLPVFLTSLSSSCSAGEALTYMQATTRVGHAGQGKPKGRWDHCHQKAEDRGTPAITLQLNTPVACFAWTCPSKDLLIVPILIPVEHPTPPTQQAIHLSQEGKWKNAEVTFQPVTSEISEKDPGNAAVGIKQGAGPRIQGTASNCLKEQLGWVLTAPHAEQPKGSPENIYIRAVLHIK